MFASRRQVICMLCLIPVLIGGFAAPMLASEGAEGFYRNKTIRIIVGYSPGGGFDAYARMIAPFLAEDLGATVIVENKPGAGGLSALSSFTRETGDGLRILLHNGEPALLNEIVEPSGRYQISRLALLGRVSFERRTLMVRRGSPLEDVKKFSAGDKPLYFGAGDRIDSFGDAASIFCYAMKAECKLVFGFPGASDIALSVARGELDAFLTSDSQAAALSLAGDLKAVAVLSSTRAPLLPDVPSLKELIEITPESYKWVQFRSDIADFGRVLVMQADTPPERVEAIRNSLARILSRKDVVEMGAKTNRPIAFSSAAEVEQTAKRVTTGLSPEEQKLIRHILLDAY